jgi:hypothetical protein
MSKQQATQTQATQTTQATQVPVISNQVIYESKWTPFPAMNGVRPPNPSVVPVPYDGSMYSFLDSQSIEGSQRQWDVRSLQTNREPYTQQELITKYGNMESRVGTNMGR